MKLSVIDRKIVRELGVNARFSYKEIAERINSKKEIVAYHVAKLEDEGIIKKYVPVISLAKLGMFVHKIYLRFQGLTREQETQMILKFHENPHIMWMVKSIGTWDLMMAFYCRNILEFAERKEELFKEYGQYI